MTKRKTGWWFGSVVALFLFSGSGFLSAQQDGADVVIGKYRVIHSEILNEDRTLLIHLPRDYEGGMQTYPVVYLLYGDHVTTYFAEAVSVLDRLGPTGRIPECILVGIQNTDRYRDLLPLAPDGKPTGIGNFIRFLKEEAFPFIEEKYRTKNYRILVGPQAGAGFGLYTLFEHPDMFQACIIDHPFRWQGGRDEIIQKANDCLASNKVFKKFVSITYNDADPLAREGVGYIKKLADMITARNPDGFSLELNFIEKDDEFLQRLGLREGLKKLFERYPFPENRKVERLDDILAFYRELSRQIGFEVDPPEHVLTVQGDGLLERGKTGEVIEILQHTMERYPRAANSYFRMANMLTRAGELEQARIYLHRTVELIPSDSGMFRSRLATLDRRIATSAAYLVEKAVRSSGTEAGIEKFRELKGPPPTPYYFDEGEFNELGYRLLQSGNLAGAVAIFTLNVEWYPASANAYDSLGEAYQNMGNNEKAIENYRKSLELNPKNSHAVEMLKKLEKTAPERR